MRPQLTTLEITTLSQEHYASLVLFARQWTVAGAEDIVQSAFLSLVRENSGKGKPENPPAWLYKVVRNEAISQWRSEKKRKIREEATVEGDSVSFVATAPSVLEPLDVAESLERLPVDLREVVFLRIWAGLSFEEIGETNGKSRSTVWRLYHEGLTMLKQALTK